MWCGAVSNIPPSWVGVLLETSHVYLALHRGKGTFFKFSLLEHAA